MFDPLDRDVLTQALQLGSFYGQLSQEQREQVVALSEQYPILLLKKRREEFRKRYALTSNFALGDIVTHFPADVQGMVRGFSPKNRRVRFVEANRFDRYTPPYSDIPMDDCVFTVSLNGRLWSVPLFAADLPVSSSYFEETSMQYIIVWEAGYRCAQTQAHDAAETIYEAAHAFAGYRSHFLGENKLVEEDNWEYVCTVYLGGFYAAFREVTGRDIVEECNQ